MTHLTTLADPEAAAARAAQEIARALSEALERRGAAHFALAGGNTPRRAYELLAELLPDWSAIELWYGDERCVDPEDPESNHRLVVESLLARIRGAPPREHRMRGELGAEQAARAYAVELREHVPPTDARSSPAEQPSALAEQRSVPAGQRSVPAGQRSAPAGGQPAPSALPALDLALLGLGEDGHTASLFPGHAEVQDDSGALCLAVHDAPKPPPDRGTLSMPVLRAARRSLLLVTGAGKADALAAVLAGPDPRVPASLLASGRLHVIADDAAAPAAGSHPDDATPAE
ncbi:MAG TPA: 6-phosphogluconolactonase [Solirubrobacteraceae bacterium]|nr:6-phosphogluconolactonase [Solirubrobacteraceae bacterium]